MSYSGIILAGGQSKRMGQDKALMEFDGIPMIQHIANTLRDFTNEIIVASNFSIHHQYGDHGVLDNSPNSGPMAGIEAGVSHSGNAANIVISCDAPFVDSSIIEKLIEAEQNAGEMTEVIIATCDTQIHPLIGIYRKSALDTIRMHLQERQLRMTDMLNCLNVEYLHFSDTDSKSFLNINTQEEWNQAIGK